MSSNNHAKCLCSEKGYAPDCPQAFFQGGKLMHTLEGENQLKPRSYELPNEQRAIEDGSQQLDLRSQYNLPQYEESTAESSFRRPPTPSSSDDDTRIAPLQLVRHERAGEVSQASSPAVNNRFFTEEDMRVKERVTLDRFKPLSIGKETMTEVSIGGYKLDLAKVATKAIQFIELPPVCLPLIFMDKELNFNHHFFQGMEMLLGRETMESMTSNVKHSDSDKKKLLPTIKKLITVGYLDTDNELTVFVKRVLSFTFETLPPAKVSPDGDALLVGTNLYGFQYIEQGMLCKDAELRMWLHIESMRFKMSWFNAFKSSGIPKFATDGVQDRYESELNAKKEKRRAERLPRQEDTRALVDTRRNLREFEETYDRRSNKESKVRQFFMGAQGSSGFK